MALINATAIPNADDYELEQSLKFNDNDSASLSWTPTSAGNRTTWTWSGWIKLGSAGDGWHMIFSAGSSSNGGSTGENLTGLLLYNNSLYIYWDSASGGTNPSMKLRDSSAWYHVCLVATSSSLACYINGTLAGTKSGSGNGAINNTLRHGIGVRGDSLTSPFDGYMSEIHFIDGTAVAATSFGETGTYGEWKPVEYSGTYGNNGFYLNFAGGGIMSATGGTITTDGDYKVHSFTSNGTFTPSADGYVEYLVIAGGGGGGSASDDNGYSSGGGGAGGYRTGMLSVTAQGYSITVGAGGAGGINGSGEGSNGTQGANSVFSTITSIGGGYGATANQNGGAGGSGGGAAVGYGDNARSGGSATSGQGYAGGGGLAKNNGGRRDPSGGGGGAGQVGYTGSGSTGGNGGNGLASSITGSSVTRAGGGAGDAQTGGSGGGGSGRNNGTANTGSGGGGSSNGTNHGGADGHNYGDGGSGGSGIVIIRYKFQ